MMTDFNIIEELKVVIEKLDKIGFGYDKTYKEEAKNETRDSWTIY